MEVSFSFFLPIPPPLFLGEGEEVMKKFYIEHKDRKGGDIEGVEQIKISGRKA
jgi:hypothetical protein